MTQLYYYDDYGCVTTDANLARSTELAPPTCPNGEQPVWTGSGWMCLTLTLPSPPSPGPSVGSAYNFYMSFTSAERVAIHSLSQTDMIAYDFMFTLQMAVGAGDTVASNNPDILAGLAYLQANPPSAPCLTAARVAQIIAGI